MNRDQATPADPRVDPDRGLHLEVLHVSDCPNLRPLLDRLHDLTDTQVSTREVSTEAAAAGYGMAGSPTLLVNRTDPFATRGQRAHGLSCRLYRDEHCQIVPVPSITQLRNTLASATGRTGRPAPEVRAGEVLTAWRTRALPLDPVEKAVHQAILRGFATTGQPPSADDLDAVTAGTGLSTIQALGALHDLDAIRLGPDARIRVAYPFSATPTRHRVHIRGRADEAVHVHAMCAVDALGISAMLGQDTRIESVDLTTGQPITVTTTAGRATWTPPGAVVFIGADAGGGPCADCCCDRLNFFAHAAAATAWANARGPTPGQILTQAEAQDLACRLFGPLLTPERE